MFRTVLITIAALAVLSGCERKAGVTEAAIQTSAPKAGAISPSMEPKLQALATSACRCEQTAKDKAAVTACWAPYSKAREGAEIAMYASACVPISDRAEAYNVGTPQSFNVYTGSASPIGILCSTDEVKAVETAWLKAQDAGQSQTVANAAMRRALRDLKAGRPVAMTGGTCG